MAVVVQTLKKEKATPRLSHVICQFYERAVCNYFSELRKHDALFFHLHETCVESFDGKGNIIYTHTPMRLRDYVEDTKTNYL